MESPHANIGPVAKDVSMPSLSASTSRDIGDQQDKRQTARRGSTWRHLFAFTEQKHIAPLALAVLAAACAAGAKTSYAIFLGKVMDVVTPLGAGTISKESAMTSVSFWCVILTAVGAAAWVFNSAFMAAWVIFGELIAKNARATLFDDLLYKDMAWFDSQQEGISSVLSSIEM